MGTELVFDRAPDLRRIYAAAVRGQRAATGDGPLPDVVATRPGIRVDVEHLARFGEVTGAGLRDTLPLTYPHLLAFPLQMAVMGRRGFPLPLLGSVHVENVITTTEPLPVREEYQVRVHAESLRDHPRGRQVDLVSEVGSGGQVLWRGVSTYLATGKDHPDAAAAALPDLDAVRAAPAGPVLRLGSGAGREWAGVSGDWNPIHLHPWAARPLGFPTAIAHGVLTYTRVVAALGSRLPDRGLTSRVWFRKPVPLPSTLRLRSVFEDTGVLSLLESAAGRGDHVIVAHSW